MLPLIKVNIVSKVLYIVNLLAAVGIIIAFSILPPGNKTISSREARKDCVTKKENPRRDYSYYAKAINYRHLFIPLIEETPILEPLLQPEPKQEPVIVIAPPSPLPNLQPPEPIKPTEPPKIPLSGKASSLNLIGIIGDEKEKVAVIQDKRLGREYLLKQGDLIQGIIIKEVCEDRVILWCENEQLELQM